MDLIASKFHQLIPGGQKTCRKQCGGQAKKGREKILETPRNCVIPNILSMNFFRLYLHVLCFIKVAVSLLYLLSVQ